MFLQFLAMNKVERILRIKEKRKEHVLSQAKSLDAARGVQRHPWRHKMRHRNPRGGGQK